MPDAAPKMHPLPRANAPLRLLVDTLVDAGLPNAQMGNAREIIRRLDPARFHVTTFSAAEPDPEIAVRPNTKLIRLPAHGQTLVLAKQFLTGPHEILFYMKAAPASLLYSCLRKRFQDRRVTIGTVESQSDLHSESSVARSEISRWQKTILKCDFLYSNSSSVKENLRREYGLSSEVVPTGVDCKFFYPVERTPNARPQVLFVGSLRPFKQPDLLLKAAARFPGADFTIVGEGSMRAEIESIISRTPLPNARLSGVLDAAQLRELYRASDIFLFPSTWEGSPKVILEAAACGLPVIARSNYSPETVVDGRTGFTVSNNDELFQRLAVLLNDPILRDQFGKEGRKHALTFDWDIIVPVWEEIFLRVRDLRRQQAA